MGIPAWLRDKTPQVEGRKFEKRLAKKVGGRVQPGSGAFSGFKEDVLTSDTLIQLKKTTKSQYTLKLSDLETLRVNAVKIGKEPVFVISMGGRLFRIQFWGYDK